MASSRYYIQDDTAVTGTSAGTGQQLSPIFTAVTPADAATLAQQYSQMFQRAVRLVPVGGAPPYTPLFSPSATCLSMLSSVPSGISY